MINVVLWYLAADKCRIERGQRRRWVQVAAEGCIVVETILLWTMPDTFAALRVVRGAKGTWRTLSNLWPGGLLTVDALGLAGLAGSPRATRLPGRPPA